MEEEAALKRLLIIGGLAAALSIPFAAAAQAAPGPNSGTCPTTHTGGASVLPVADPSGGQAPNVYGTQTGTTGGQAGVDGNGGFLEAGGDAASGGYVSGSQDGSVQGLPASGLNGTVTVSQSPSVCVGVAGQGGVNS